MGENGKKNKQRQCVFTDKCSLFCAENRMAHGTKWKQSQTKQNKTADCFVIFVN